MNHIQGEMQRKSESDLERMIEPLASYICAAGQPRAALNLALAVLADEVDQIDRAAHVQITVFSGNHGS